MRHIYLRGDVHGNIREINQFAYEAKTTKDDLLIILGDAGFNYYVKREIGYPYYRRDDEDSSHRKLAKIPLTIAVVQGNHEAPAWWCDGMQETEFCGAKAYQSVTAPNVYYLKNGEIYTINNQTFLCMGGAYSVDKACRTVPYIGRVTNARWFPEEQMTDEEFETARKNLEKADNKVDYVLAHTCPRSKMPQEMLMAGMPPADNRMEDLFEAMQHEFSFKTWFFGHFHTDRWIDDRFRILFHDVIELRTDES